MPIRHALNHMDQGEKIQITGFIIPAEWDEHGTVILLAIITESFEKFIVETHGATRGLYALLDRKVSAEGNIVGEDLFGNKIIRIHHFKVLGQS